MGLEAVRSSSARPLCRWRSSACASRFGSKRQLVREANMTVVYSTRWGQSRLPETRPKETSGRPADPGRPELESQRTLYAEARLCAFFRSTPLRASGMLRTRTPVASKMALPIAGARPNIGTSPAAARLDVRTIQEHGLDHRHVREARQAVIGETAVAQPAILEFDLLE